MPEELIELEEQGWRALSSTGEQAAELYEQVLDDPVLFLLPGGLVLDDRAAIVRAVSGQPWSSYELRDAQVLRPTPDIGIVGYRVAARRGDAAYEALMSSTYVRRETGWKLAFHQQTPV
jgi:hypothetical protein